MPSEALIDAVGYAGTVLLAVVYVPQVVRSFVERTSVRSVSAWTLGLQLASNACFVAYSGMLHQLPVLVASACVIAGASAILALKAADALNGGGSPGSGAEQC